MSKLDFVKEWIVRARSKASALCSRFSPSIASNEEGQFGVSGVIVVIMLGAIVAVTLGMMGALEYIIRKIAEGVHLTGILVHIPQIHVEGMWFSEVVDIPDSWSFIQAASSAGGSLYSTFQLLSVIILTAGFILIGLSHVLEQFSLMNSGTSEKLLSESVLIIVLIFIFPYFYNASAAALNAADEKVILSPAVPDHADSAYVGKYNLPPGSEVGPKKVTKDIATAAGTAPGGVIPDFGWGALGDFIHQVSPDRAIAVLVTMTASFMAVLIAFATGVFKIIATVALAAAFPLILSLRLIPFLRDVSTRLTSSLIGLMLASLVIAIFFRVGWEIMVVTWTDFTFRWATGVALLMAAAGAFTITAPAMSGMSAEISGTMGRSTAGAVGGMVATGGTAALGGVVGTGAAGLTALRGGAGKAGAAAAMGKGFGQGTLRGAPGSDVVGSMTSGAAGGKQAGMEHLAGEPGGGGQHPETSEVMSERLGAEFNRQKGKPVDALSQEDVQAGKRYMGAINNNKLNPEEAHYAHGKAREIERGEEGKWTDTRIKAVREKGELTTDEINQGMKDSVGDVKKSTDWKDTPAQRAQLHAALGKVMQGKKPGE